MDAPINTCCKNKIKITAPLISFNKNAAKPVVASDKVKSVNHSIRVRHSPRKSIDSTNSSNASSTISSINSRKHSKSKSVRSNENSLDRNCFLYYNRKQLDQASFNQPCRIRQQQQQFNPSYNFYGNANCFSGLFSAAY